MGQQLTANRIGESADQSTHRSCWSRQRILTHTLPNLSADPGRLRIPFSVVPARTFSERLRAERLRAGLTQKQLSLRAGCSWSLVFRWEREYTGPSRRKLEAVATVLGISADYLRHGRRDGRVAA